MFGCMMLDLPLFGGSVAYMIYFHHYVQLVMEFAAHGPIPDESLLLDLFDSENFAIPLRR